MRKFWFTLIVAGVLLSACGQAATPVATPTATNPPEATATTAAAATLEGSAPSATKSVNRPAFDYDAQTMPCTIEASIPEPNPTDVALFPPAGANDWVSGPATAQLVITEYSDFQ